MKSIINKLFLKTLIMVVSKISVKVILKFKILSYFIKKHQNSQIINK